ncbi:MAG: hypothetical protein K1X79_04545 [Oligoflexia bacterium]|nr:hypothetical protein [Oligoflexia bacterium]
MQLSSYYGKYIAFATKHRKEQAVQEPFRKILGAGLIVPWVETDQFGTFSGEVQRQGSALYVAERKARLGMQAARFPLGLASEGSFGPHPHAPYLSSNQELLLFIDDELGFMVHEMAVTVDTNYAHKIVSSMDEIGDFLCRAKFPSHALIVRPNQWVDKHVINKAINQLKELEAAVYTACQHSSDKKAWIETDMRANFNPSRMKIIGDLAQRLATRLSRHCPGCSLPGWGVVDVENGLRCEYCGAPTETVAFEIFGCARCNHRQRLPRADGRLTADAMQCQFCNP